MPYDAEPGVGGIDHLCSPGGLNDRRPWIKNPLDDELSDLRPQLRDLGFPRGLLALVIPREAGQYLLPSLLLPVGNQVRMHIVAGRQLRQRRFLAKRLQRDLRLQLSRDNSVAFRGIPDSFSLSGSHH